MIEKYFIVNHWKIRSNLLLVVISNSLDDDRQQLPVLIVSMSHK